MNNNEETLKSLLNKNIRIHYSGAHKIFIISGILLKEGTCYVVRNESGYSCFGYESVLSILMNDPYEQVIWATIYLE